ncbi:MAG: hypothetical protein ACQESR_17535 [Planctomycetota bacterium]
MIYFQASKKRVASNTAYIVIAAVLLCRCSAFAADHTALLSIGDCPFHSVVRLLPMWSSDGHVLVLINDNRELILITVRSPEGPRILDVISTEKPIDSYFVCNSRRIFLTNGQELLLMKKNDGKWGVSARQEVASKGASVPTYVFGAATDASRAYVYLGTPIHGASYEIWDIENNSLKLLKSMPSGGSCPLLDTKGRLWIPTSDGTSCFDIESEELSLQFTFPGKSVLVYSHELENSQVVATFGIPKITIGIFQNRARTIRFWEVDNQKSLSELVGGYHFHQFIPGHRAAVLSHDYAGYYVFFYDPNDQAIVPFPDKSTVGGDFVTFSPCGTYCVLKASPTTIRIIPSEDIMKHVQHRKLDPPVHPDWPLEN